MWLLTEKNTLGQLRVIVLLGNVVPLLKIDFDKYEYARPC